MEDFQAVPTVLFSNCYLVHCWHKVDNYLLNEYVNCTLALFLNDLQNQ